MSTEGDRSWRRYRQQGTTERIHIHSVDGNAGISLQSILPKATGAARPAGRARWLECPICGNVSKAASHRYEDGTCQSVSACRKRAREAGRDVEA